MNKFLFVVFVFPASLMAQANRYFVTFKDKANAIYSVGNPQQFLSQKSIDRRARESFATTEEDFPVNQGYVQQVKATGAEVYFMSRWFNGVLIQTTPSIATTVGNLSCVRSVELVAPGARLSGGRTKANQKLDQASGVASDPLNQRQNAMIGLDKMHMAGFYGEGVDVAVFDSGFNGVDTLAAFKPLYKDGRVKSVFNFVQNSTNVYAGFPHGTWVLSIMAGNVLDKYQGGVPNANYFLYQTEDASSEYRVEEYNWLFAAEKADSAGVDVVNSSLGYSEFDDPAMNYNYADLNGNTTVVARAARKLIDRGVVVVNAAGNEGGGSWRFIDSPADVDGIIAVGGVDAAKTRVAFSSIGPSVDGRIKPDVSAQASGCFIINEDGGVFTGSGTSFASPLIACLVTGLRQALPNASVLEIYSRVINSATQAARPDNLLGYGIPQFGPAKDLTNFADPLDVFPNPTSGQLKIIFKSAQGEEVEATLFDIAGREVMEWMVAVTWADNPLEIDLTSLSPGVYLLRVQVRGILKSLRIVRAGD